MHLIFYYWAHCDHIGVIIQNGVIYNQQTHFGHSGSKHSECAQFLTIAENIQNVSNF